MICIVFPAEGDAKNFYKQVHNRKEMRRTLFAGFWQHLLIQSRSKSKSRSTRKEEEYNEMRHHRQVSYLWLNRGILRARRPYEL